MYTIKKTTGPVAKHRLIIKGFKTSQAMHEFLNKQYDNDWSEVETESLKALKPGTYAFVGGKWVNVKKLDISVLAHV